MRKIENKYIIVTGVSDCNGGPVFGGKLYAIQNNGPGLGIIVDRLAAPQKSAESINFVRGECNPSERNAAGLGYQCSCFNA